MLKNSTCNYGASMKTFNGMNVAAMISGIIGLFLLWRYGDVLMETKVKPERLAVSNCERLARCGLGLLILAIALHLTTWFR
jgi:hypothetical protein